MELSEFGKLWQESYALSYSVAMFLTKDKDRAEDLLQTAATKALKHFDNFDGKYPKAWFKTIIRNQFFDDCKKAKKVSYFELDMNYDGELVDSAEMEVIDNSISSSLLDKLNNMPPGFKETLYLFSEGYDTNEIAKILNIKPGTVSSRISRVRKRFADARV